MAVVSSSAVKGEGESGGDEIITAILGSYMITEERVTLEEKEEEGRREEDFLPHSWEKKGKLLAGCLLRIILHITRKSRELWGFAS